MSDADERRSAQARALAERALVLLMTEIGDDDVPLIVLGRLVPEVLTRDTGASIPQHLGTADVDVLLLTHLDARTDLGRVERALKRLDFKAHAEAWRWRGPVDGRPCSSTTARAARKGPLRSSAPARSPTRSRPSAAHSSRSGRYMRPNDFGPSSFAEQSLQVDPELDPATLRADAADVVDRFVAGLRL